MKIFAHRGYSGRYPENTAIAFQQALKYGCDGIECDVQLTKDGVPVIIHDESMQRTARKGDLLVKDLTLSELKKLDVSAFRRGPWSPQRILTLQELLDLIQESGQDITLNLELKNSIVPYPGLEEIILKEVQSLDWPIDILFSSFNHDSIRRLNSLDSGLTTAPLVARPIRDLPFYVRDLGSGGVHLAQKVLTGSLLQALQAEGLFVNIYTVNSLATARRYEELNVTGIFTDHCVEIKEELTHGTKSRPDQTRWSKTKSHRPDHRRL